jgi:DNA-binding response OmpR family regulator
MPPPLLLLVDDAPEIGLIVRRLGQLAGHEVVSLADAESAWQWLTGPGAPRPQLLLLDINLPGASGVELCRRLRAAPALAGLPVAVFAHWERGGDIAAGLEAGADFVLSKDLLCDPEAWRARLEEILAAGAGQTDPRSLSWRLLAIPAGQTEQWLHGVNQTLRHPAVQPLGVEVMHVVLGRALRDALRNLAHTGASPPCDTLTDDWFLPRGAGLNPSRAASFQRPEFVVAFALALAGQVERLLGASAGAQFRNALKAATPLLSDVFR